MQNAWLKRLHRSRQSTLELGEFYVEYFLEKLVKVELRIFRLQKELDALQARKSKNMTAKLDSSVNTLNSTLTSKSVTVLDITTGLGERYPSARAAALALQTSHSTIMNKLKNKNTKVYKGRYVIKEGSGSCPGFIEH